MKINRTYIKNVRPAPFLSNFNEKGKFKAMNSERPKIEKKEVYHCYKNVDIET